MGKGSGECDDRPAIMLGQLRESMGDEAVDRLQALVPDTPSNVASGLETHQQIDLIRIASGKNRSALRFGEHYHRGQVRKGGNNVGYFTHCVAVADVLAAAGADRNLVCAGVLHDTVEDTEATLEEIWVEFGPNVAALVDAVTKTPEIDAAPMEEKAGLILQRLAAVGLDAYALKGADILVNMTDLVLDAETDGVEHFAEVFKNPERAAAKIGHYLRLAAAISEQLRGTRYDRLADAIDFRAAELTIQLQELTATAR